jgi:hypothetical protein
MLNKETIRAYRLTTAVVEVLEEAGVSDAGVDEDFVSLVGDGAALLDKCLNGADDDRVEGWRQYVACLVAANPAPPSHTVAERRAINARWINI